MDEEQELLRRIAAEIDGISPRRQLFDRLILSTLAAVMEYLLRRWLFLVNLTNGVIVAGALAVPVMMAAGFQQVGSALFSMFSVLCQQIPSHSYFLLGYQMALDQRMTAIYGSSLLAGIAFVPLKTRMTPLSWRAYFPLILPMAVDGFTQLFGWRISTWELRTATGGLFGVGTVWLMYPWVESVIRKVLPPLDPGDAS